MTPYNEMLDVAHCLRKEIAFNAKAAATTDPVVKAAYEATAREYRYRALLLKESKRA